MSRNREEGLSIGQEKELLDKLTSAGISAKEAQAIISSPDNALAKKLIQVASEYTKDTEAEYGRWFDHQLERLRDPEVFGGYPSGVLEMLKTQRTKVITMASMFSIGEGNIPFVPVVPREFRTAFDQFNELGIPSRINLGAVEYEVEVPKHPYYMFDVDYHFEHSGGTLEDARFHFATIYQPARTGLVDVEIAALKRELSLRGNYNTTAHFHAISAVDTIKENGKENEYAITVGEGITASGFDYVSTYHRVIPSCVDRLNPDFSFREVWAHLEKGL